MVWLKRIYNLLCEKFGDTFNDTVHFPETVIVIRSENGLKIAQSETSRPGNLWRWGAIISLIVAIIITAVRLYCQY